MFTVLKVHLCFLEQNNGQVMEEVIDQTITTEQTSEDCLNHEEEAVKAIAEAAKEDDEILKHQSRDNNYIERIPPMEHDYILQQECILSNNGQQEQQEQQQQQQLNDSSESFPREDCAEYVNLLVKAADVTSQEDEDEDEQEEPDDAKTDVKMEEDSLCQETRRSKRKLVRRSFDAKQNSDEENYFENLNLSSRLKSVEPSDKSDKVFFLCYLCDKEFLSKSVLKEHMHSHEEVRKALSLKKPSETPEKSVCNVAKSPPSGKRSNKCPYCGKQYIYIISYSKHLKKHEREKEEGKEEPMPLEISFHEDEHSLDLEDYEDAQHSNSECRKRAKRKDSFARTKTKKLEEDDDDEDEEHGQDENEDEGENQEEKDNERNSSREEEQENQSVETFPFACDKCSQKFHTKRGLRKHSVSHVVLKCSICEEEFDSMEKLRNHRAKHVVEGVLSEQDFEADTTEYAVDKESGDYGTERKETGERIEDGEGGEAERVELENGSGKSDR